LKSAILHSFPDEKVTSLTRVYSHSKPYTQNLELQTANYFLATARCLPLNKMSRKHPNVLIFDSSGDENQHIFDTPEYLNSS